MSEISDRINDKRSGRRGKREIRYYLLDKK